MRELLILWRAMKFAYVCSWKGHPFKKDGNPFARMAGIEVCLRCGCHYDEARGNVVAMDELNA